MFALPLILLAFVPVLILLYLISRMFPGYQDLKNIMGSSKKRK